MHAWKMDESDGCGTECKESVWLLGIFDAKNGHFSAMSSKGRAMHEIATRSADALTRQSPARETVGDLKR